MTPRSAAIELRATVTELGAAATAVHDAATAYEAAGGTRANPRLAYELDGLRTSVSRLEEITRIVAREEATRDTG